MNSAPLSLRMILQLTPPTSPFYDVINRTELHFSLSLTFIVLEKLYTFINPKYIYLLYQEKGNSLAEFVSFIPLFFTQN